MYIISEYWLVYVLLNRLCPVTGIRSRIGCSVILSCNRPYCFAPSLYVTNSVFIDTIRLILTVKRKIKALDNTRYLSRTVKQSPIFD
jgi:hypothetical protein